MKISAMENFTDQLTDFMYRTAEGACRRLSAAAGIAAAAAFCLLTSAPAWALESDFSTGSLDFTETSRDFELEINGTFFTPRIDDESGLSEATYSKIFGKDRLWLFEAEFDYEIVDLWGPLGVGAGIGFGSVSGKGVYAESGEESKDSTSLSLLPLRLMAVYRFQYLDRRGIPLIPFVKAGLGYTFWWSKGTDGSVSKIDGRKARGGKWGYNLAIGLALSLNFIDRTLARDADRLWGLNDTHILIQFVHATADNFGGSGFDLSRDSLHLGLGFEF